MQVISVECPGTVVDIGFAIQSRMQDNMTLKDTICFGMLQGPLDEEREAFTFIPAIAYQSRKDRFNKLQGKRIALTRFLQRNTLMKVARTEVWEVFNKTHNCKRSNKKT